MQVVGHVVLVEGDFSYTGLSVWCTGGWPRASRFSAPGSSSARQDVDLEGVLVQVQVEQRVQVELGRHGLVPG